MKSAFNHTKGLRTLYDQFERMEALKQDTNQDVFVNIMTLKIPKEVLLQLQFERGSKIKWTVGRLRELLSDYISVREETEEQCNNTETAGSNSRHHNQAIQKFNRSIGIRLKAIN